MTRIWQDGTTWRRTVDTAQLHNGRHWEELAAQALAAAPPYRPLPGSPVYHISVDDHVILVAEHDLRGPLRDLVTAVMAAGGEVLAATRNRCGPANARQVSGWPPRTRPNRTARLRQGTNR